MFSNEGYCCCYFFDPEPTFVFENVHQTFRDKKRDQNVSIFDCISLSVGLSGSLSLSSIILTLYIYLSTSSLTVSLSLFVCLPSSICLSTCASIILSLYLSLFISHHSISLSLLLFIFCTAKWFASLLMGKSVHWGMFERVFSASDLERFARCWFD